MGMILTKLNENGTLYTTSTKESSDTNYIFVASNSTTQNTVEYNVVIASQTPRIDVLPIPTSGSIQDIGYYDYLLLKSNFSASYDTVTKIQLDYPDFIVERGKMLITSISGSIPSTEYDGNTNQRKQYNG